MITRRVHAPFLTILAATSICLIAGTCIDDTQTPDPNTSGNNATLRRFASEQELVNFVGSNFRATTWFDRFGGLPLAAPTADAGESTVNGADFSTTNLQEAGVDEGDVLKSDGKFIYVARGKTIRIVQADPSLPLSEVANLTLDHHVSELYLTGNTLFALGNGWPEIPVGIDDGFVEPRMEIMIWPPYFLAASVFVTAVDISTPASPTVIKSIEFDGSLVSSRLIGNRLHLVMTFVPNVQPLVGPLGGFLGGAGDVLPAVRTASSDTPLVNWSDVYRPDDPMGYNMTTVITLDTANIETIVGKVGVMANCGTIYASDQAIYLTSPEWYEMGDGSVRTVIHKFAFDANGAAQYVATGNVPGELLNQFSLGEYNGNLRVATYLPPNWGGFFPAAGVDVAVATAQSTTNTTGENAVFVLGGTGDTLETIGSIEGIAPGERLYAARFLGNRGYLVTFRRIDPLFVLDLSDAAAPEITGELKIPGYSDYLHAIGDSLLLGVGRSVKEFEWGGIGTNALQISLFNVADPADPKLIEQVDVGGLGSYSDVSYSHKAFTIKPDGSLIALPATLYPAADPSQPDAYIPSFQGVALYGISANGIEPAGSITAVVSDQYGGWTEWKRGAFIGNTAFSVSNDGVRRAPLSALSNVAEVQFSGE